MTRITFAGLDEGIEEGASKKERCRAALLELTGNIIYDDDLELKALEQKKDALERDAAEIQAQSERFGLTSKYYLMYRGDSGSDVFKRMNMKRYFEALGLEYMRIVERRKGQALTPYVVHSAILSDSPEIELFSPTINGVMWNLQFKCKQTSDILISNALVAQDSFDDKRLASWWSLSSLTPGDTDAWSDLRNLATRVFLLQECLNADTMQDSCDLLRLDDMVETAQEIVQFLITIFLNHSDHWQATLTLLQYAGPGIYVLFEIVKAARGLDAQKPLPAENAIFEAVSAAREKEERTILDGKYEIISHQLKLLEPYMTELRSCCYIIGSIFNVDATGLVKNPIEDHQWYCEAHQSDTRGSIAIEVANQLAICVNYSPQAIDSIVGVQMDFAPIDTGGSSSLEMNVDAEASEASEPESFALPHWPYERAETLDSQVLKNLGLKEVHISYDLSVYKGSGGYGRVYGMKPTDGSGLVAVKLYRTNDDGVANRVVREVCLWLALDHPNILPLMGFAVFEQACYPCLVSKLCWGDLKDYTRHKQLSERRKIKFLRDVIKGLKYLHSRKIAHGDVRAANVLITEDSDDEKRCYAVLNDFGMSDSTEDDKFRSRNLTSVNQKTNDYWLAPELLEKAPQNGILSRVSKAGDVYALGVVFLEVMYGRDPYQDLDVHVLTAKSKRILPAQGEQIPDLKPSHWSFMAGCWDSMEKRWTLTRASSRLNLL